MLGKLSYTISVILDPLKRNIAEAKKSITSTDKQMKDSTKKIADSSKQAGASIKKDVSQVDKGMGGLTKTIQNVGKALLGAFAARAVLKGIKDLTLGLAEKADRLLDLQDITGIATDKLQEYEYVAKMAGVNTEALARATEGLTQRLARATGEASPLNVALTQLGIQARKASGELRNGGDIMDDVIDRLAEMQNVTERNVLGQQVFGGAWRDMAPILSMGAKGIEELRKEAHAMGVVLDGDALNAANEFRKEWVRIGSQFDAIKNELGLQLMPVIEARLIPAVQTTADRIAWLINTIANLSETQVTWIKRAATAAAAVYTLNKATIVLRGGYMALAAAKVATTKATTALTAALMKNPLGAIAVLLTSAGAAMLLFRNRTNEATDAVDAFNKATGELEGKKIWTEIAFDDSEIQRYTETIDEKLITVNPEFSNWEQVQSELDKIDWDLDALEAPVFDDGKLREQIRTLGRDDLAALGAYLQREIEDANRIIANMEEPSGEAYEKVRAQLDRMRTGLELVGAEQAKLADKVTGGETQIAGVFERLSDKLKDAREAYDGAITAQALADAQGMIDLIEGQRDRLTSLIGMMNAMPERFSADFDLVFDEDGLIDFDATIAQIEPRTIPVKMEMIQPGELEMPDDWIDPKYAEFLRELQAEMDLLTAKNEVFGDSFDLLGEQIRLTENALTQLVEDFDMTAADEEVQQLIARLRELQAVQDETGEGVVNWEQLASGAAASVGMSMMQMAGDTEQSTGKMLSALLRQVVGQLISQIVASIPFPANIAIAAGAGGIAGLLFNQIPALAEGGIAKGETLALIGEYPGAAVNPEVVAPLDKLKEIIHNSITSVTDSDTARLITSESIKQVTQVPALAQGGIVNKDTIVQVGEYPGAAVNPEVIAPLSKLKEIIVPEIVAPIQSLKEVINTQLIPPRLSVDIQSAIKDVGGTLPDISIDIPQTPSVVSPMIQSASRGVSIPDEITISGRLAGDDIMLSNERAGRRKMLVE